jgi:hypothetical protein
VAKDELWNVDTFSLVHLDRDAGTSVEDLN